MPHTRLTLSDSPASHAAFSALSALSPPSAVASAAGGSSSGGGMTMKYLVCATAVMDKLMQICQVGKVAQRGSGFV